MSTFDERQMQQAIEVRNLLAKRYLFMSGVSAIDIGVESETGDASGTLVVRIHVKDKETRKNLNIPGEVQGIPIQVIISNNQLE